MPSSRGKFAILAPSPRGDDSSISQQPWVLTKALPLMWRAGSHARHADLLLMASESSGQTERFIGVEFWEV